MRFFISLFILISSYCSANDNTIYDQIIVLQPKINLKLAKEISSEIQSCSKRIDLDGLILLAIYNQESKLNNSAKNCIRGVIDNTDINKKENNTPVMVCLHLGMGQINVTTAINIKHCSDLGRLTKDLKYNLDCSCEILDGFKKMYGKTEKDWWTRYNSSNREKRNSYKKLIMRFYPKDNNHEKIVTHST